MYLKRLANVCDNKVVLVRKLTRKIPVALNVMKPHKTHSTPGGDDQRYRQKDIYASISEAILNHPYFQDQLTTLFMMLMLIASIDVSTLQNFIQFTLMIIILVMMLSWAVIKVRL